MLNYKLPLVLPRHVKHTCLGQAIARLLVSGILTDITLPISDTIPTISVQLSDAACLELSKLHTQYGCTITQLLQAILRQLDDAPPEFCWKNRNLYN